MRCCKETHLLPLQLFHHHHHHHHIAITGYPTSSSSLFTPSLWIPLLVLLLLHQPALTLTHAGAERRAAAAHSRACRGLIGAPQKYHFVVVEGKDDRHPIPITLPEKPQPVRVPRSERRRRRRCLWQPRRFPCIQSSPHNHFWWL